MEEIALHRQFAGQARLVRLLLWRIGDSTDLDVCFAHARDMGMLEEDDEAFLRECMELEEQHRDDAARLEPLVDQEMVQHLFRCADKLNRADAA